MISYVLRRLLVLPAIVFLVTVIPFSLMWQLPVEVRARIYVPSTNKFLLPDEEGELVERAIRLYGLDQPWPVQYLRRWLCLLVTGDRGYSPYWQQSVQTGVLLQRAPTTSELLLASTVSCTALSPVLGNVAARCRHIIPDHPMRASTRLGWGPCSASS